MRDLEQALRELEAATAALAEIPADHLEAMRAVLDRRSDALACLAEIGPRCSEETLQRLRLICEGGVKAQARICNFRSAALAEWVQWSRIYRALGADGCPDPMRINCRG